MYDRFKELGVPVRLTRDSDKTLSPSNRINDFKVEVNDDVLTLTKYDGETVVYEKTFNRTSNISKEEVLRIFNHLQLK